MAEDVRVAFEQRIVVLAIGSILPLRQVSTGVRQSSRYRRIARSVVELGIIEPIVVARPASPEDAYILLDGHLRHSILVDMGQQEVRCLVSDDDEGFTYNKRVNRLATVQEHFMIVRALERGVPEEKLARALDMEVSALRKRRSLISGICPEVVELFKDRVVNPKTFEVLKRMKPARQIESAELMIAAANFSWAYAKALLAGTRQHDLMNPGRQKRIAGLSREQMTKMETEMETLQRDFKSIENSYGDDMLNLVIASGYISKMLKNSQIQRYLGQRHPEILEEFRAVVAATSRDRRIAE
jgi:ParB-like chromosome segregation protein Spo0J